MWKKYPAFTTLAGNLQPVFYNYLYTIYLPVKICVNGKHLLQAVNLIYQVRRNNSYCLFELDTSDQQLACRCLPFTLSYIHSQTYHTSTVLWLQHAAEKN